MRKFAKPKFCEILQKCAKFNFCKNLHNLIFAKIANTGLLNPSGMKPRDIDLAVVEERGGFLSASEIVPLAHKLGMEIGVYTFYDSRENSLFFCGLGCWPLNRKRELFYHFDSGVDFLAVENVPEAAAIGMEYVWEVLHGRSEEFI